MKTELRKTEDGSHTLFVPELSEHYHSTHGAIQESMHVFINAGLHYFPPAASPINILEIGFGTGLNALLTILHSKNREVFYTAIEAFPVENSMVKKLNYPALINAEDAESSFDTIHTMPWNTKVRMNEYFTLEKLHAKIQDVVLITDFYDLVYFDAFAPDVQAELWTASIFEKIFSSLEKGGVVLTYSSKGIVKQNLRNAGFVVERLPGPPGKRHMVRASRP